MAERRMFSKSITESDAFLDLPFPAQALYFHMAMNADDEGFINSSRRICGMCGAQENDLKTLIVKGFMIHFDSGIYVIKHWKINNKIRSDRAKDTNYPEEKAQLIEKSTGVYSLKNTDETKKTGDRETFAEHYNSLPPEADNGEDSELTESVVKESLTTETPKEEIHEETPEQSEAREKFEYETQSEPRKNYAEQVFDVLFSHNLPCCKGNLITFTMRDFRLANSELQKLHLHSDDVLAAVKNYAQVIDLKRQGLTWWNSEQTFYNFCEKKTILKFLPENFNLDDYRKSRNEPGSLPDDRIRLDVEEG